MLQMFNTGMLCLARVASYRILTGGGLPFGPSPLAKSILCELSRVALLFHVSGGGSHVETSVRSIDKGFFKIGG